MELTIPPHLFSVLEVADPVDTARRMVCHARDQEFAPYEFPQVPVFFRNMRDAKRVVACLNDHFWGGHGDKFVVCVYH